MSKIPHRLYLTEEQIPKQWYSMRADMKELPDPIINPGTMRPAAVEDLYPVFLRKTGEAGNGRRNALYRYSGGSAGDVQDLPSISDGTRL